MIVVLAFIGDHPILSVILVGLVLGGTADIMRAARRR